MRERFMRSLKMLGLVALIVVGIVGMTGCLMEGVYALETAGKESKELSVVSKESLLKEVAKKYLLEELEISTDTVSRYTQLEVIDAWWVEHEDGEDMIRAEYIVISDEMVPGSYTVDGEHKRPRTDELAMYYYTYRKIWFYPGQKIVDWWYESE